MGEAKNALESGSWEGGCKSTMLRVQTTQSAFALGKILVFGNSSTFALAETLVRVQILPSNDVCVICVQNYAGSLLPGVCD